MHACNALTLEQLICLRDGEPVVAGARTHTENCAVCIEELARLREVRSTLQSMPSLIPPPYDSSGLRARLRADRTHRTASIAAAAGVGVLTLVLITSINGTHSPRESNEVSDSANAAMAELGDGAAAAQNVGSLVIRSQELESRLQRLPRRPHIERGSTSATIDTLQSRIQWLDYQLSLSSDVGMTESQSAQLWENRIQLMDSLLKVRSAEAQRAAVLFTSSPDSVSAGFIR